MKTSSDSVGDSRGGHGVKRLVGESDRSEEPHPDQQSSKEDDVLLILELLGDRVVIHGQETSGNTTRLGTDSELLGDLLGVSTIGRDENKQRRTVERAKHLLIGLLGLAALEITESRALRGGNVVGKLRTRVDEGSEEVLTVEELLELLTQTHTIETEDLGATSLCARIPAEERPVTRVDSQLGLAQHVERRSIFGAVWT